MPEHGCNLDKFKKIKKEIRAPFKIDVDFESVLISQFGNTRSTTRPTHRRRLGLVEVRHARVEHADRCRTVVISIEHGEFCLLRVGSSGESAMAYRRTRSQKFPDPRRVPKNHERHRRRKRKHEVDFRHEASQRRYQRHHAGSDLSSGQDD